MRTAPSRDLLIELPSRIWHDYFSLVHASSTISGEAQFGLCQDVIEADHAVRAVGELVCCGGDESLAWADRSSFAGGHRPPRFVAVAAHRDRVARRQFRRRFSPLD